MIKSSQNSGKGFWTLTPQQTAPKSFQKNLSFTLLPRGPCPPKLLFQCFSLVYQIWFSPDSPKEKNPKCLVQMKQMKLNFYSPQVCFHKCGISLCPTLSMGGKSLFLIYVIYSILVSNWVLFQICS